MYTFDMNSDPNIRRQDYGWNHPSMADTRPTNCDAAVWEILDPNKTVEEAREIQKKYLEVFMKEFEPLSPEMEAQVDLEEFYVPGLLPGDPDVRCLKMTPKKMPRGKRPAVLHIHGGGMIMGAPEMMLAEMALYVTTYKCVLISVAYRLLPAYTYPAAINDVEAVVNYILENQDALRIDPDHMVVTGQSSGGYMAACATQRMKMRGKYQFAGAMLIYPVIDDTFAYPSSDIYYGEVWHPIDDQKVFEALLGPNYNRSAAPPDAIPIHCKDFTGLPPTVMITGDLDYGHDPVIDYAQGLMNAGIFCDLHVYGGCFHGFMGMAPGTEITNRALRNVTESLGDLLSGGCIRK